jgi:hypothetical protein
MCKNHIKYNPTGLHLEEIKRNPNYHEHGFKFIAGGNACVICDSDLDCVAQSQDEQLHEHKPNHLPKSGCRARVHGMHGSGHVRV